MRVELRAFPEARLLHHLSRVRHLVQAIMSHCLTFLSSHLNDFCDEGLTPSEGAPCVLRGKMPSCTFQLRVLAPALSIKMNLWRFHIQLRALEVFMTVLISYWVFSGLKIPSPLTRQCLSQCQIPGVDSTQTSFDPARPSRVITSLLLDTPHLLIWPLASCVSPITLWIESSKSEPQPGFLFSFLLP